MQNFQQRFSSSLNPKRHHLHRTTAGLPRTTVPEGIFAVYRLQNSATASSRHSQPDSNLLSIKNTP
ncbi:hypothetical protein CCACVL1_18290 [Corchorus capsularis]|uniref:Uncharacterized protein n=1 Tax=Corchorus capsularis TaxID=210143 RepID=A0A1R3HLZ9_COCAP|nr:hypothetical protein CCACVL1_18290 [Corchorus capsularis]